MKPRNAKIDRAVYIAVRCAVALLQALPMRVSLACGDLLAKLAYRVDRRHREVARENLRFAFAEWDEPKIDRTVRGCYRHFCRMVVEMAWLPRRMRLHNYMKSIHIPDEQLIVSTLTCGRPVLIVTGHFGNWEMAGYAIGAFGFRSYAIARDLDNPLLDKFVKSFRQRTGQTILSKRGDFDKISAALAGGGAIATLGDQDAGERGEFVPYFGRPASTHKAVALLAMQYDAVMMVVGTPRIGLPMQYRIEVEEVIDPRDFGHTTKAMREMTERFTSALERIARRHPEQYFWLHRRWKHKPKVRAARKAA